MTKEDKKKEKEKKLEEKKPGKIGCPLCEDTENLRVQGRCVTCISCGWSLCNI